jgi:hypothetical protein
MDTFTSFTFAISTVRMKTATRPFVTSEVGKCGTSSSRFSVYVANSVKQNVVSTVLGITCVIGTVLGEINSRVSCLLDMTNWRVKMKAKKLR